MYKVARRGIYATTELVHAGHDACPGARCLCATGTGRAARADSARPLPGAGRASKSRVWAESPLLHNPTNIDIDRDGRIWVAEGVRYRSHHARQPEGDRIVVLEDTDHDGKADAAHTFVQEPALIAPLGIVGDRQQDHRLAAARSHRLHRRRSQPAIRSGDRQARGAADRLPGHQPRPLAALGDGRSRRQVVLQLRQHRRDVHRPVGQDVPHLRLLPSRPGRARSSSRTTRRSTPASRATTGTCTSADSRCG